MCFAAPCSSVREYRSVVAIQHTVQQVPCGSFVDISLRSVFIKYSVKAESLIFRSSAIWSGKFGAALNCMVLRWVEDTARISLLCPKYSASHSHRHLSSTTFNTGRMPFDFNEGAGAPASEPSPRKRGPSGTCVNCAASRTCAGNLERDQQDLSWTYSKRANSDSYTNRGSPICRCRHDGFRGLRV